MPHVRDVHHLRDPVPRAAVGSLAQRRLKPPAQHVRVEEAAEAIDKGLAKALLECWISF